MVLKHIGGRHYILLMTILDIDLDAFVKTIV